MIARFSNVWSRRKFLVASISAALAAIFSKRVDAAMAKRVIVLGMDGLDPKLIQEFMAASLLPNFERLRNKGHLGPLETTMPPQSPVSWASIGTGLNPKNHGIFDFLNRNPKTYTPELSILKLNRKNLLGQRDKMFMPVLEKNSFWDETAEAGIRSTTIRWPINFPPKKNKATVYSGLGVPDLRGGLGTYSFFSTNNLPKNDPRTDKHQKIELIDGAFEFSLKGPKVATPFSNSASETKLGASLINEKANLSVKISNGNDEIVFGLNKWSGWLRVSFKVGFSSYISGIVKFYAYGSLKKISLYATPIQIDPKEPAYPISNPEQYVVGLRDKLGEFYTLGIPEDTKALTEGAIDEKAFIDMCHEIVNEQEAMLLLELEKITSGVLSFVFFSTDRIQHIFWVTRDKDHPLYNEEYAKKFRMIIQDFYVRMDEILGKVLDRIDDTTPLIVCSDHGFTSYRRSVHLNTWLEREGFLSFNTEYNPKDPEGGPLFRYVDWENTVAYAVGFSNIFLNQVDREPEGIVKIHEREDTIATLKERLLAFKDPDNDCLICKNVYVGKEISNGVFENEPDLVVGFSDNYRMSWQTAIGGAPEPLVEDNLNKWSGDHIVDKSLVPGIIATNFAIKKGKPSLIDVAPTVLKFLGVNPSKSDGQSLLQQ